MQIHASAIRLKRAYEAADKTDGIRVLVDRLWPRGISKDAAKLDAWMKELGPTDELRTWFGHRADRWNGFRERYQTELHTPLRQMLLSELESVARRSTLTLVYGARDKGENEAVVLREYVLGHEAKPAERWTQDLRLLVTLAAVAAAHGGAEAPVYGLRLFMAPRLADRELDTALQALQEGANVRKTSTGWRLTARALKQVRELSSGG